MITAGSALHFTWAWSGRSDIVAVFAPVNESTWEHLKMGYWSLAAFSVVEFLVVGRTWANFAASRFVGVVVFCVAVVGIFYGYTAILGRNFLWMDITTYMIACAACQAVALRLLAAPPLGLVVRRIGIAGFVGLGLLFAVYTFDPPRVGLFEDPVSGTYGIPPGS